MANTYNPYSAVNNIYNLKGQWEEAYKAGDQEAQNRAASKAQAYYKNLIKNGYSDVADELKASNYANAKTINDKWAKTDKTSTRPYLYTLGQKYNMSQSDVDKIIGWDNDAQQLSIGGKVVGTPDSIVDGVSYWSDTTVLDKAFDDYVKRTGTTPTNSQMMAQNSAGVQNKIEQLWGMQTNDHNDMNDLYKKEYESIKNTNPFTTEEAKAILAKYDLAGLQGRDNAVASGSASNGGNIDSYAAANAMRQQAALTNQGHMAVLDAHQQKIDNARSILEGLGAYQQNSYASMQNSIGIQQTEAQRLFENDEAAKNNEVARLSEQASVTGYVPEQWTYSNNIYLNSDGTVKSSFMSEEFDNNGGFTTVINNAKEKLKTTTNAKERANLEATIAQATQAKALKTLQNPEYAKYAHEISSTAPMRTEAGNQFDKTMQYNYDILEAENAKKNGISSGVAAGRVISSRNGSSSSGSSGSSSKSTTKPTLTAAQALSSVKNGVVTQATIDAFNYYYSTNYTLENPPVFDKKGNLIYDEDGNQLIEEVDTSDYTVTNPHGDSWILVNGISGRISLEELKVGLANGTIIAKADHAKKTVRYAKK